MAKFNQNSRQKQSPADQMEFQAPDQKPLGRNNFILMAVAGVMIVAGFILMLGSPTTPDAFNPEIFSTRRIIVGPAIAFMGFIFMAVGIIRRPKF